MRDDDFPRFDAHLRGSVLFRVLDALGTRAIAAAASASTTHRLRMACDRFARLPPVDRLRAAACFGAIASVAHLALLRLVPAHIAPTVPKPLWVLVAATAVFAAVFAERLVASWPSSRLRAFLESRKSARRRAL